MFTSYFSRYRNRPNGVSIALYPPKTFKGRLYPQLAPLPWIFFRFKNGGTEEEYIKDFYENVLDKLDPQTVYDDLGPDAVLCCYEGSDAFCHRKLVAKWLMDNLNITITEWEKV